MPQQRVVTYFHRHSLRGASALHTVRTDHMQYEDTNKLVSMTINSMLYIFCLLYTSDAADE